jgi:hypothetical protein
MRQSSNVHEPSNSTKESTTKADIDAYALSVVLSVIAPLQWLKSNGLLFPVIKELKKEDLIIFKKYKSLITELTVVVNKIQLEGFRYDNFSHLMNLDDFTQMSAEELFHNALKRLFLPFSYESKTISIFLKNSNCLAEFFYENYEDFYNLGLIIFMRARDQCDSRFKKEMEKLCDGVDILKIPAQTKAILLGKQRLMLNELIPEYMRLHIGLSKLCDEIPDEIIASFQSDDDELIAQMNSLQLSPIVQQHEAQSDVYKVKQKAKEIIDEYNSIDQEHALRRPLNYYFNVMRPLIRFINGENFDDKHFEELTDVITWHSLIIQLTLPENNFMSVINFASKLLTKLQDKIKDIETSAPSEIPPPTNNNSSFFQLRASLDNEACDGDTDKDQHDPLIAVNNNKPKVLATPKKQVYTR